jgi:DNA replication licensing factor MCM3
MGENMFMKFFNNSSALGILEQAIEEDKKDFAVFEKYNPLIHNSRDEDLVTRQFLQQYISYAKTNCFPQLTDEANMFLNQKWAEMRQKDFEMVSTVGTSRVMPVTVRTLESLIRLATAHAKCRLSKLVQEEDCQIAYDLIKHTLFGDDDTYILPITK